MTADHPLITALGLQPHPEGGWYRETWRSPVSLPAHGGTRASATAIQFLLLPGERSRWHRVRSAELWLWQGGGTLALRAGGTGERPAAARELTIGPDPAAGQLLSQLVEPDEWQEAEPTGDQHVLVACVVSPGFDYADWTLLDS
jgi:hypothetical protein